MASVICDPGAKQLHAERRRAPRFSTFLLANTAPSSADTRAHSCAITEISETGCRVIVDQPEGDAFPVGGRLRIEVTGSPITVCGRIVRRIDEIPGRGVVLAVQFDVLTSSARQHIFELYTVCAPN